jgi:hypothetical protein
MLRDSGSTEALH